MFPFFYGTRDVGGLCRENVAVQSVWVAVFVV